MFGEIVEMGDINYKSDCACNTFKCSHDCRCSHSLKNNEQLEIMLNEMLSISGMIPEERNTETPEINEEIDENIVTGSVITNSKWIPVNSERSSLGNSFNDGILAFNEYVKQVKRNQPESPPRGAIYPCRLQYENIQDNLRQEEEQRKRIQKQQDFNDGVLKITQYMEEFERNKPEIEDPFRPPIYPCRFERERILWAEQEDLEMHQQIKNQEAFDKRVAEVNIEMKGLMPKVTPPQSPPKPPTRVQVGTISSRQIRQATEAKTREMFSNENMKKYNTCWSKPFKPHVIQTPPTVQPRREVDLRGLTPPVKFSPLYSNFHKKMAAYVKNCEYFDKVKQDRLKNMFRDVYKLR